MEENSMQNESAAENANAKSNAAASDISQQQQPQQSTPVTPSSAGNEISAATSGDIAAGGGTLKMGKKKSSHESQAQIKRQLSSLPSLELPVPTVSMNLDCLLLQHTTLDCAPTHLLQLFKDYQFTEHTSAEVLMLLIYIIALESGYCTVYQYTAYGDDIVKLTTTSSFHAQNVLKLCTNRALAYSCDANKTQFGIHLRNLVDIESDANVNILCSLLTAFVTGDFLIITLTPDHLSRTSTGAEKRGFSMCLPIARYVINTTRREQPLQQRFRKLDALSLVLREQLFVPMRNKQLAMLGVHLYPSICGLPPELYDEIFRYFAVNDFCNLAQVSDTLKCYIRESKYSSGHRR